MQKTNLFSLLLLKLKKSNQLIDSKEINLLKDFVTGQGKILPRYKTGVSIQQQRKITKIIKRVRRLTLCLSFIRVF